MNILQIPMISTMQHFAKIGGFNEMARSIRFAKTFLLIEST